MATAAFTVTETAPRQKFRMEDGEIVESPQWHRVSAAENAAVKVLGRAWFKKHMWAYTTVRNLVSLTGKATQEWPLDSEWRRAEDLELCVATLRAWLAQDVAAVQAAPDPVGYRVLPDGGDRLLTTADGRQHHTKPHCYSHMLVLRLTALRPAMSHRTVRALCNSNGYSTCPQRVAEETTDYKYLSGWRHLWSTALAGPVEPGKVERVAAALTAMAAALRMDAEPVA